MRIVTGIVLILGIFFINSTVSSQVNAVDDLVGVWEGEVIFGDNVLYDKLEIYKNHDNVLSVRPYRDGEQNTTVSSDSKSQFYDLNVELPSITWKMNLFRNNNNENHPNSGPVYATIQGTIENNTIYGPLAMPEGFSPSVIGSVSLTKRMAP